MRNCCRQSNSFRYSDRGVDRNQKSQQVGSFSSWLILVGILSLRFGTILLDLKKTSTGVAAGGLLITDVLCGLELLASGFGLPLNIGIGLLITR